MDRSEAIKRIRTALFLRSSGRSWSVTGGRGTAWGWIRIDAPPARRTAYYTKLEDAPDRPESYFEIVTDAAGGHTTPSDRQQLAALLHLDTVHHQGVTIPASSDYYQEYIDRAEGRKPNKIGEPYWD